MAKYALAMALDRYKFYDQERLAEIQSNYTLDDLRLLLKGKTWEKLVRDMVSVSQCDGVFFFPRIGVFMQRSAIAVCALNMIVAMRYFESQIKPMFLTSPITGDNHSGYVLMPGDFGNGRLGGIKITDLVIQGDY